MKKSFHGRRRNKKNNLAPIAVAIFFACACIFFFVQVSSADITKSTFRETLSPELGFRLEGFARSYKVLAICSMIENGESLDDTLNMEGVRKWAESSPVRGIKVVLADNELIIDIPEEGLAVRYFDPFKANLIVPYSDLSELSTRVINPRLHRQVIVRIKALPDSSENRSVGDRENIDRLRQKNRELQSIYESEEGNRPGMKELPTQIVPNQNLKKLFEFHENEWDWKKGDGLALLGGLPFEGETLQNFSEILDRLREVEPEPVNLYVHRPDTLHFTIAELLPNTLEVNDIEEVNRNRQNKLKSLTEVSNGIGPIRVDFYYRDLTITGSGEIVALGYVRNNSLFDLRDRLKGENVSTKYTGIVHVTIGRIFEENISGEKLESYKRVIRELRERETESGQPRLLGEITTTDAKIWDQRCDENDDRYGKAHPSVRLSEQPEEGSDGSRDYIPTPEYDRYFKYLGKNKNMIPKILNSGEKITLLRVPVEAIEKAGRDNIRDFLEAFQRFSNGYVELFYMTGRDELPASIYARYGLTKKELPPDFEHTRQNTITLFPVLKGETINRGDIGLRIGKINLSPEDTILSPIGLQNDPAGLIRATVFGMVMIDMARSITEPLRSFKANNTQKYNRLKDRVQVALQAYMAVSDAPPSFTFSGGEIEDMLGLVSGDINSVLRSLNKLIELLPITPINSEELRRIYEKTSTVLMSA